MFDKLVEFSPPLPSGFIGGELDAMKFSFTYIKLFFYSEFIYFFLCHILFSFYTYLQWPPMQDPWESSHGNQSDEK